MVCGRSMSISQPKYPCNALWKLRLISKRITWDGLHIYQSAENEALVIGYLESSWEKLREPVFRFMDKIWDTNAALIFKRKKSITF